MRGIGVVLLAALAFQAAPAAASFDPYRQLAEIKLMLPSQVQRAHSATLLDEAVRPSHPGAALKLTDPLDVSETVKLAGGGAGRGGAEPFVAFVLGFIGFGLGHWYAGDPNFTTWTIIDVIILVIAVLTFVVDMGIFALLFYIAWVAERVLEGVLAYQVASGYGHRTPRIAAAEESGTPFMASRQFQPRLDLLSFSF